MIEEFHENVILALESLSLNDALPEFQGKQKE